MYIKKNIPTSVTQSFKEKFQHKITSVTRLGDF